jgi:hypothetical protein
MRKKFKGLSLAMLLGVITLFSCGAVQRTAIYVGESDPADFTLSNTKPEAFAFEIPAEHKGPFDFAIELTYFENQLQGWEALPLYYTLTHPDGKEEDKRFSMSLKDEKGAWRGELKENQTDRIFEQNIQEAMALSPGKYAVKLFGDNTDLAKPILGIVHVAFKVYAY